MPAMPASEDVLMQRDLSSVINTAAEEISAQSPNDGQGELAQGYGHVPTAFPEAMAHLPQPQHYEYSK